MKERELWDLTIETLEEFYGKPLEERTIPPEDLAEQVLQSCLSVTREELVFVRECASGLTRFEKLCEGTLAGYCQYYHRHKKSSYYSMLLMAYIMIFRYREIGGHKIRELFLHSTNIGCIAEYLEYILNEEALKATAVPLWLQSYDIGFINSVVLESIRDINAEAKKDVLEYFQNRPEVRLAASPNNHLKRSSPLSQVCSSPPALSNSRGPSNFLGDEVASNRSGHGFEKALTTFDSHSPTRERSVVIEANTCTTLLDPVPEKTEEKKEYPSSATRLNNLHQEAANSRVLTATGRLQLPPKEVRDMELVLPEPKAPPVPVDAPPVVTSKLRLTKPIGFHFHQREKEMSHRQSSLTNATIPSPLKVSHSESGTELRKAHVYVPPKPLEKPLPTTTSTLLREATTYQSKKKKEIETLKDMEAFPHDISGYDRWKAKQMLQEEQQREIKIIERHLEALKTEENVRQMREAQKEKRQEIIQEEKEKRKAKSEREARIRERERENQKNAVQLVKEKNKALRSAAVEKCLSQKIEARNGIKQALSKLKEEGQEREEAEKAERAKVIQKIKQFQDRSRQKQIEVAERKRGSIYERPNFSENEYGTMSIAELRDELERVRDRFKEEEEERRQLILSHREAQQRKKENVAALCAAEREKSRKAREELKVAKEKSRQEVKAYREAVECNMMMDLHQRLEVKREKQREELARLREMERQHSNEVLLRTESAYSKEHRHHEQEERCHSKRVAAAQAYYADPPAWRARQQN